MIRRRNSRFGEIADGTMTVTEWATQRALLRRPRRSQPHHQLDALEQVGDGRTKVMVWVDMHDLDDSRAEVVRPMIEASMANMSRLLDEEY